MSDKQNPAYLPAPSPQMVSRARALRQSSTSAEQMLWARLRGRRLQGIKFRRQHPIGTFVADFYCDDAHLVIEVDGAIHAEPTQAERDQKREQVLQEHGLALLRIENEQILGDIESVSNQIAETATSRSYRDAKL